MVAPNAATAPGRAAPGPSVIHGLGNAWMIEFI